jgi:hypothetical protein
MFARAVGDCVLGLIAAGKQLFFAVLFGSFVFFALFCIEFIHFIKF